MKTPCSKDCAERSASCHCSCTAYQEYYKANAEKREEISRQKARYMDITGERMAAGKMIARRNGRRR